MTCYGCLHNPEGDGCITLVDICVNISVTSVKREVHGVTLHKVLKMSCCLLRGAGGCVVELGWTGGLDSQEACHGCWDVWAQWTVDI